MKKLIIAVAMLAMGVAANAATYKWQYEGYLNNGDGEYGAINDTTAYLFNAATLSQSDLLSSFYAANGAIDLSAKGAVSSSSATVDGVTLSAAFEDSGTSNWTAYFAIIDGGNLYISSEKEAAYAAVGTSTIGFGDQDDFSNATFAPNASYSGAGWYAVPEPTSGLLMLLGMAGLALRRRRA